MSRSLAASSVALGHFLAANFIEEDRATVTISFADFESYTKFRAGLDETMREGRMTEDGMRGMAEYPTTFKMAGIRYVVEFKEQERGRHAA